MSGEQEDLCVVHLAREVNGIDTFARFIDSYRRHPAGTDHELAVVLKGFGSEEAAAPYRELADDLCAHWIGVPDDGFDLGAYRRAVGELPHRQVVLLNSFSVIQVAGWLETLRAAAEAEGVGAVGASGSWGSQSSHVRYELGLGGPYREVFADPETVERAFASLVDGPLSSQGSGRRQPWARRTLAGAQGLIGHTIAFPAFPAVHLRSTCLLIGRELWLSVCDEVPPTKLAAYRFESGRHGLTRRLRQMGLRVVVAGRDRHTYETPDWPASNTFWQQDQENLLVADKQTRAYAQGGKELRRVLAGYAWGRRARVDPAGTP